MKVLIIGATGRTGLAIVDALKSTEITPVAGVRSHQKAEILSDKKIETLYIDVENMTVNEIANQLTNIDSIVFASGASQSHPERAMWIDLDGAVKTMQAAKQTGIKKFIMISAAGAEDRATWDIYDIPDYYIAKYYAEQYLKTSNLNYTVIRPAILTDHNASGKVSLTNLDDPRVSRKDVALVTVQALLDSKYSNQAFNLYYGKEKIENIQF